MTGVGGDLFALVFDGRTNTLRGLERERPRGLARRPGGAARARSRGRADAWAAGPSRFPDRSWMGGAAPKSHGTIPLSRALSPAIRYARDGFAVSEIVAAQWNAVAERLATDPESTRVLLPQGRAPDAGEVFSNPDLATTLEQIAASGRGRHLRWAESEPRSPITSASRAGFSRRPTSRRTRPTGSSRIRTTYRGYHPSTKCRRTRRASSRWRC